MVVVVELNKMFLSFEKDNGMKNSNHFLIMMGFWSVFNCILS